MNGFLKVVSEDIENVRIRQADSFGPYSEFTERWLEEKTMPKQVSVNGFYRFDAIMQALFGEERVNKTFDLRHRMNFRIPDLTAVPISKDRHIHFALIWLIGKFKHIP